MSTTLLIAVLFCLLTFVASDVVFNTTRLSSPRDALSLIEADSNLYFVGGFEFHGPMATATIEVFDLDNRTWTTPLQLPSRRGYITPVVLDSRLYFVGGYEYSNPPYVYDEATEEFVRDHGRGPTVFNPVDIALHESTLTVIGTYSVDFLDLKTKRWNYSVELTNVKMNLMDAFTFAYEDIVVVIGGMNITTRQPVLSAWIYNRTSNILDEFPTALTDTLLSSDFEFTVTNRVISVWSRETVILHRLDSRAWHQISMDTATIVTIASSNTMTFIFNTFPSILTFNWSDTSANLTSEGIPGLMWPFAVDGYVAYVYSFRDAEIRYFDDTSGSWNAIAFPFSVTFTKVKYAANAGEWTCLASKSTAVVVNIRQSVLTVASNFTEITKVLGSTSSCHFFDEGSTPRRYHFELAEDSATLVEDEVITPRYAPVAIVGDTFFTANGGVMPQNVTLTSFKQAVQLRDFNLWVANDRHFVMMEYNFTDQNELREYYSKVDIYDLEAGTWLNSTDLPFTETARHDWYLPAAALGDKLAVWKNLTMAVYDPQTGQWSLNEKGTLDNANDIPSFMNVHVPVLTVNDTAFLRTNFGSFTKHRAESPFKWMETKAAQLPEFSAFVQYFAIANNQIFTSIRETTGRNIHFSTIYLYDIELDSYDISLLPESTRFLTIVPVGDFVVGFTANEKIFYYEVSTRQWYTQDYNSTVNPSAVYKTSKKLSVVVGGNDEQRGRTYSDAMLMFEDDSITIPPASPIAPNGTVVAPVALTDGELAAAIVVPIGAALIAGALLLILLLRKKRKQKGHQGNNVSMAGLAAKYGQWFIPFDQIKFGEQLGRGASGQVFKGSWKGSSVALKVSMTQANSTVIGELELMIQMRPHPNVVQLFGFSVHPETDSIILVIEFCDGGSLDDLLFDTNQQLSLDQKTALMLGIAKGLSHLHSNNIVHRDVASRNVLLHKNEAKLTDFGMSRLIDEDTQRGTTKSELGPIRWMSPESLKNKEYSVKSDVWSFGVLMYEIVSQQEPHLGADPIEIGRLIRDNGATPVIPDTCPSNIADIMRSCWHVNPGKRPTIEQIIERIENSN